MRVALISLFFAPEITGIAVYSTGLAQYLADSNCEVTVHTDFPFYPGWSKRPADRGKLFRRESLGRIALRRCYLYVPDRPTALRRIVHEASFALSATLSYLFAPRADVTIIVSPPLPLGVPLALLAKLKGSRIVFHVQDLQPDAAIDLGMLKPGLLTKALTLLEHWTYALADRVSTISEGMRARIITKGLRSEKVLLFRNWADDDLVTPMSRATRFRDEWALGDRFVVLYSGNMGVKQGLDSLLDCAERLRHRRDLAFVIVGDGGEKNALLTIARERDLSNVLFKSLQPAERLPELLATADVAVIPQKPGFKDIVFPSKLANILASARPVIAAAAPDSELAAVVRESGAGLTVTPGSGAEMATAIEALIADPAALAERGANGRAFVLRKLGKEALLSRFRDDLIALAGETRRG